MTEITLRHAEVLEHDELGVRPLRTAEVTDRFIFSGDRDVPETVEGEGRLEYDRFHARAADEISTD